jgi:putative pyruvate formate lyase activating enzyme
MPNAAYLAFVADGSLRQRADAALAGLAACTACARRCGADRRHGVARAACRIGATAKVAFAGPAVGAEACFAGAGEILFAGCNLRCLSCSIADASWGGNGADADASALADMLLSLQDHGHRLVMLTSPSHVPAQILDALCVAAARGFHLPLAWQSGGYDGLETLALLEGVIDLYVADVKHGDAAVARMCTGVADYPAVALRAVAEMYRQVGGLQRDAAGLAQRGLLVRHLVLPNGLAGAEAVFAGLPQACTVHVMAGYVPAHRAGRAPKLNRRPSADEVAAAQSSAVLFGAALL